MQYKETLICDKVADLQRMQKAVEFINDTSPVKITDTKKGEMNNFYVDVKFKYLHTLYYLGKRVSQLEQQNDLAL